MRHREKPPVFVTMGPEGTNHALVTRRYMEFHGLGDAPLRLVAEFRDGLLALARREADYMVQVAVHPDAAAIAGEARFRHAISIVDVFISPSRPLAVLTRTGGDPAGSIALQPATAHYVDTGRWATVVPEHSIQTVAEGLLEERYDSGLTALSLAAEHPGRFTVDTELGTIDDAWMVYGREAVADGDLVAWDDSPLARRLRR